MHLLRGAALFLLAILVLPGYGADEKKDAADKDDKKNPDAKKDVEKPDTKKDEKKDSPWVKAGQVSGTIVSINESQKSLRLKIGVPKLKAEALQALNQASQELNQANQALAAAYAKPAQRADQAQQKAQAIQTAQQKISQVQQKMAYQKANMYTTEYQEHEIMTIDEVVVRLAEPAPKFDDKGKKVKFTAKELKELKGTDTKLPGYTGDFSDLRSNQMVQCSLVRDKASLKPMKVGPKPKDADVEITVDNKPQISMVYILAEPKQPGEK